MPENKIITPNWSCIFPSEDSKPKYLYHYTDIRGLQGILSTRALWATDLGYMNDSTEYVYADALIEAGIAALGPDPRFSRSLKTLLDRPGDLGFEVYACCFCDGKDLLSQWRAYGGSGTGYVIEFSLDELQRHMSRRSSVIGKIEYSEVHQKTLIQDIVSVLQIFRGVEDADFILEPIFQKIVAEGRLNKNAEFAALFSAHEREFRAVVDQYYGQPLTKIQHLLLIVRAFLKSPVFSEEREWRIVCLARPNVSETFQPVAFRTTDVMFVPYLPVALAGSEGKLPISRIIIGPSLRPLQAKDSLRRFLGTLGLESIQVDPSMIPLRV